MKDFGPSFVLLAWAGFLALGCSGLLLTVSALVLLIIFVAVHIHTEMERHHVQ